MQYILPNKLLWYIAVANVFCLSAALRRARLVTDLSPEVKHFDITGYSVAYFLYEWAGILYAAVRLDVR